MSWFKEKVEDWDMVGKALERSLNRVVVVTDTAAEDEDENFEEVDLDTLRRQDAIETTKNKQVANAVTELLSPGD